MGAYTKPIDNLPTVLKPPVWGRFIDMHIKNGSASIDNYILQTKHYRCTHRFTSIFKVGSYYFCLHIPRGYRNLASLKRLV